MHSPRILAVGHHGAADADLRERGRVALVVVRYEQQCPRCGAEFQGDDKNEVADAVVAHAGAHGHSLDREVVLAHLEGVNPHDRESD